MALLCLVQPDPVLFAFLAITVWMFENGKGKYAWMPMIPGGFYCFICSTYIANARSVQHPLDLCYIIGVAAAVLYVGVHHLVTAASAPPPIPSSTDPSPGIFSGADRFRVRSFVICRLLCRSGLWYDTSQLIRF